MVTNDYSKTKFPDAPRMWDTYESKMTTINSIWVSTNPQVWGLFVMNTWTSTGHTGIVQSVNWDGTFTATDANAQGSPNGWPVKTSTYNIWPKTAFSVAPQATSQFDTDKDATYKAFLDSGKLPAWLKTWTKKANDFEAQATAWKEATPSFVAKDERDALDKVRDNYTKNSNDPRYWDYKKLESNVEFLKDFITRADQNKITSQDKQALISNFAKVLDPSSVVRDSEYATTAGFTQSKIEKLQQEVNNYFDTGAPMWNEAAKALASGLQKQYQSREKAYNNAIQEAVEDAEQRLWRKVEPIALWLRYSENHPKAKQQEMNKIMPWITWWMDFAQKIIDAINQK